MNAADIQRSFADFCGIDRYRQFVATIWSKAIPKQRLVFWQEQLWKEFCKTCTTSLPASFDELQHTFEVCPRHLAPLEVLEPGRVDSIAKMLAAVPEDDRPQLFPFAVVALTQRGLTKALSCPTCRSDLEARSR